ncbi:hypothetical protein BC833DRAFT_272727, partial [Globomyces pollinis-pini]
MNYSQKVTIKIPATLPLVRVASVRDHSANLVASNFQPAIILNAWLKIAKQYRTDYQTGAQTYEGVTLDIQTHEGVSLDTDEQQPIVARSLVCNNNELMERSEPQSIYDLILSFYEKDTDLILTLVGNSQDLANEKLAQFSDMLDSMFQESNSLAESLIVRFDGYDFNSISDNRIKKSSTNGSITEKIEAHCNGVVSLVDAFCTSQNLEVIDFFKLIWAVTLKKYYQINDVVFVIGVDGVKSTPIRMELANLNSFANLKQAINVNGAEYGNANVNWSHFCQIPFDTLLSIQSSNDLLPTANYHLQLIVSKISNDYQITAHYDPLVYEKTIVEGMTHSFMDLLQNRPGLTQLDVNSLEKLSNFEQNLVQGFENGPIEAIEHHECLTSIKQHSTRDPDAIAVASFGQDTSYHQLDIVSDAVAQWLVASGVSQRSYVAIIDNRSTEMIICMLAVLKAGAAFVPIDANLPFERISYIIETSACPAVICGENIPSGIKDILQTGLLLEMKDIKSLPTGEKFNAPIISALDPAYAIFTSGSTGKPKGVMISHGSLSNFVNATPNISHAQPGDRVGQVQSISFDMSLKEIFCALAKGATLVLRDENDFEGSLKSINILLSTPTTLLSMDPATFPNLKIAVIGGEKMPQELVRKWASTIELYNCYGPTETTMSSSVQRILPNSMITIGKPLPNTVQYILNQNLERVPQGVAGELFIGGAGVGIGYLNRDDLTREKFILNHLKNDGSLMYRTGDICRWTQNGEIQILGRTDDMVKVKGYRIELDEVAKAIESDPTVSHAAAIVKDDKLVAFVTPESVNMNSIYETLTFKLPYYMIPSAIITLAAFPTNSSSKIDKKALMKLNIEEHLDSPETEDEKALADIWASLLNVKIQKIGRNTSFFSLGGDSITVIQLVARLKQIGWSATSATVFRAQTLKRVAAMKEDIQYYAIDNSPLSGSVPLTPIQKLFFERGLVESNHYNQSMLLAPNRQLEPEEINKAMTLVASHHDMLRATFNHVNDDWLQQITPLDQFKFASVTTHTVTSPSEMKSLLSYLQKSLSITDGKLYAFALIDFEHQQRLFIAIHHLVIDWVSWRVILEDLENIIDGNPIPDKSTSFQTWAEDLVQYQIEKPFELNETVSINNQIQSMIVRQHNTLKSTYTVKLEKSIVDLLERANKPFNTNIQELVLTSLTNSLSSLGGINETVRIFVEGHGREQWKPTQDLTRTVGWFTSIFPITLTVDPLNSVESVRIAKQALRSTIAKSITYKAPSPLNQNELMIKFNYLGRFQGLESADSLFNQDQTYTLEEVSVRNETLERIMLTCYHSTSGELVIDSLYDQYLDSDLIHHWLDAWTSKMTSLTQNLLEDKIGGFTASDFDLLPSNSDMKLIEHEIQNTLGQKLENVDDIYPCTPLQAGLVLATIEDPKAYFIQSIWRIQGDFDISKFQLAFSKVVEAYSTFRTTFLSTTQGLYQVVLKNDLSTWKQIILNDNDNPQEILEQTLSTEKEIGFSISDPSLVRFSWFRIPKTKNYVIVYSHHHGLTDGWSSPIFIDEILNAYSGISLNSCVAYRKHISHVLESNVAADEDFWRKIFEKSDKNSPLPYLSVKKGERRFKSQKISVSIKDGNIKSILSMFGTTAGTIIRAIWALVLKSFTPGNSIVFGSVISGRDSGIPNIESAVGLMINTIPVPVDFSALNTISDLFSKLQTFYADSLPHSNASLIDIKKWGSFNPYLDMFETLLIHQNYPKESKNQNVSFQIDSEGCQENVDYPICIETMFDDFEIHWTIDYDAECITETSMSRIGKKLEFITEMIFSGANHSIKNLLEISQPEKKELLKFARGAEYDIPFVPCHEGFEKCAYEQPDRIAIEDNGRSITYGEVNNRANVLASMMATKGVKKGHFVGLISIRSIEFIVGMFACLKLGAAYVAIDSDLPLERVSTILDTAECQIILYHPNISQKILESLEKSKLMSLLDLNYSLGPFIQPSFEFDDPALVIFTSGSTGRPKGIVLKHGSVSSYTYAQPNEMHTKPGSRVAQLSSISFDMCLTEVFTCLTTFGTLIIRIPNDYFGTLKIASHACITPTALGKMEPIDYPMLEVLVIGGEACPQSLIDRWAGVIELYNGYGPSEITAACCNGRMYPGKPVTIGKPMPNTLHYVVDKNLDLVPIGVPGELLVGGHGVCLGYLNQPELTAEKFIPNHFENNGSLMYRTGDICTWTADGELITYGRQDDMIKVKGYRIELEEVANVIGRYSTVSSSTVMVNDGILVAYVTPESIDIEQLMEYASDYLPFYMLPSRIIPIQAFPMNQNGKVDKKALIMLNVNLNDEIPQTAIEIQLANIWSEVLNVSIDSIYRTTSFFELGGDSISAIQLVGRCADIGLHLTTAIIFKRSTLARMATSDAKQTINIKTLNLSDELKDEIILQINDKQFDAYPATPLQSGMIARTLKDRSAYCNQLVWKIPRKLDKDILSEAIFNVAKAHDILRTFFVTTSDGIYQVLTEKWSGNITIHDDLNSYCDNDFMQGFSLEDRTWFRVALIGEENNYSHFVFTIHHVLYDGWCLDTITDDIFRAYSGEKVKTSKPFKSVVEYIQSHDETEAKIFWENYLQNLEISKGFNYLQNGVNESGVIEMQSMAMVGILNAASKQRTTIANICKAAWTLCLQMYTQNSDIVFGTVVSGRDIALSNAQSIVGPLFNTIPSRLKISLEDKLEQFLHSIQEDQLLVSSFESFSLSQLQKWAGLNANEKLINTLFVFENIQERNRINKTTFVPFDLNQVKTNFNEFELQWIGFPGENSFKYSIEYDGAVFNYEMANAIAESYDQILRSIVNSIQRNDTDVQLKDICKVSKEEEFKLLALSKGPVNTIPFECAHHEFENMVLRDPNVIAVEHGEKSITYGELNDRANIVAANLTSRGV